MKFGDFRLCFNSKRFKNFNFHFEIKNLPEMYQKFQRISKNQQQTQTFKLQKPLTFASIFKIIIKTRLKPTKSSGNRQPKTSKLDDVISPSDRAPAKPKSDDFIYFRQSKRFSPNSTFLSTFRRVHIWWSRQNICFDKFMQLGAWATTVSLTHSLAVSHLSQF